MEQKFKLHAHEVWREKLVREGEYAQSGDFSDVIPPNVWSDLRFVFGRYGARGRDDFAVGNIIFRPENGAPEENFFVADEVHNARKVPHCNLGEFVFGSARADIELFQQALRSHSWGRVFYVDNQGQLRREGEMRPLDWGFFLAANGVGVWKWTMRDGVTWGKTSPEGLFRWKPSGADHARFLSTSSTPVLRAHLENLLADENSEVSFARRWLQMEEQSGERSDFASSWTNGARMEAQEVLRWLLIREMTEQGLKSLSVEWQMVKSKYDDDHFWSEKGCSFPRLERALSILRVYFGVKATKAKGPLCVEHSLIERSIALAVHNPTAHEQLEAHQQLRSWAKKRGLSFD